jgi:hypothetical protein
MAMSESKHTPAELIAMGWNACRRSVYAVCEEVAGKPFSDISKSGPIRGIGPTPAQEAHSRGFNSGWNYAGKSISRGFSSMEALDDDNVQKAIAELPQPTPSEAFSVWLNEGPKLAAAAGCHVGIKVTEAKAEGQS